MLAGFELVSFGLIFRAFILALSTFATEQTNVLNSVLGSGEFELCVSQGRSP